MAFAIKIQFKIRSGTYVYVRVATVRQYRQYFSTGQSNRDAEKISCAMVRHKES